MRSTNLWSVLGSTQAQTYFVACRSVVDEEIVGTWTCALSDEEIYLTRTPMCQSAAWQSPHAGLV